MPDIDEWISEIGRVGEILHNMGAAEGGAGNISLFLPAETTGLRGFCLARFPRAEEYRLPNGANLPHGTLLVTGSRRRLRDIVSQPDTALCAIQVESDGTSYLHHSKNQSIQPTSEIDSHIGIHSVQLAGAPRVSAVVHAQPPNTTYLTHVKEYRDQGRFNRQLYRWQPETIAMIPQGIRVLGFETPGTPHQGELTQDAMVRHKIVVWAKHGVISRSTEGPMEALDLIEYVEAAATYERFDIQAGRPADGLSLEEMKAIARRFDIHAPVLENMPAGILEAS
ncbi:MAG: class II aldolase/adducin family protein [Thermomicrobiales bacterium]